MGEYTFVVAALCSSACGILMFRINPQRSINRTFLATSVWISLWFLCVALAIREGSKYAPGVPTHVIFWLRLNAGIAAYLVWFVWLMRSTIIEDKFELRSVLARSLPWLLASTLLATLTMTDTFISPDSTPVSKTRGINYFAYCGLVSGLGIWGLLDSWRRSQNLAGIRKLELQYLVFIPIATIVAGIGCSAVGAILDCPWLRRMGALWLLVMHATAMWSVCYHRIFDAKQIIASIVQKSALLCVGISSGYGVLRISSLTTSPSLATAAGLLSGATAIMALDGPMRRILKLDPQQRLAEPRQQIIAHARQESDELCLRLQFEDFLRNWCHTEAAALLVWGAPPSNFKLKLADELVEELILNGGWLTPENLHRRKAKAHTETHLDFFRMNALGALIAVPKGGSSPSLLVALGQKTSLRPYTFPDVQLLQDLTELMDNILTHSRVAEQAARIEKMEAAMMMSRGLAHDLNNLVVPVSVLLGQMKPKLDDEIVKAPVFDQAIHALKTMEDYVRESLFFSRQLSPEFESGQARKIVEATLRVTQRRAQERQVRIECEQLDSVTFLADHTLIQRLLQNLIQNAIDASSLGQRIEIWARRRDPDLLEFGVKDQGVGIPEETGERIFEPYFTTKTNGKESRGLGLGLAICRKIAELHHGTISVSKNLPSGTIFTFTLPLLPPSYRDPRSERLDSTVEESAPRPEFSTVSQRSHLAP